MKPKARRASALRAALADPSLLAHVPPIVAASFGVLPLHRTPVVLTVACTPDADRAALRLLQHVLGTSIVATPFEPASLRDAIRTAYFRDRPPPNFPTFPDPDFLQDPHNAPALRHEKVEHLPAPKVELPSSHLALATWTLRTTLTRLDAPKFRQALPDPARIRHRLGDLDLAWAERDDRLWITKALPDDDKPLLVNEFHLEDVHHLPELWLGVHEVRPHAPAAFPHILHPTELQLVGIDVDGALQIYANGSTRTVAVGAPSCIEVCYNFLSYGVRHARTLRLVVHDLRAVARNRLHVRPTAPPWSPQDLTHWFGLSARSEPTHDEE